MWTALTGAMELFPVCPDLDQVPLHEDCPGQGSVPACWNVSVLQESPAASVNLRTVAEREYSLSKTKLRTIERGQYMDGDRYVLGFAPALILL